MRGDVYLPDLKKVQEAAKTLNLQMTRPHAERLLEVCLPKIKSAVRSTVNEVIRGEVERYLFDQEDKELG